MADITISRQNYALAGETPSEQYNGWAPNTGMTEALSGTAATSGTIPADFKDHKTVFFCNASGAATITFAAGDTYGAHAVDITVPSGNSLFWLDSTKFADKVSGEINYTSTASVTLVGYEMR